MGGGDSWSAVSAREKEQDPLCRSTLNPRNQTPHTKPFFTARYRCFPLPPPSLKKRYVKLDLGPLSDAIFGAAAGGRGVSIRRTEAFLCRRKFVLVFLWCVFYVESEINISSNVIKRRNCGALFFLSKNARYRTLVGKSDWLFASSSV